MSSALLYLLTRSFWNAVVSRIKRLRQPKYLVGAILGVAYFYFYFYRFLYRGEFRGGNVTEESAVALTMPLETTMSLAAMGLLVVVVAFAWVFPASRAALAFSEAEVSWLFAAPLTRGQLIRFKLIKSQVGLLIMALLMTLLTGRLARDGHAWQHALGWWIVFATLQMHRLGASFALTRLLERGLSNFHRRLAVLAVLGAFVLAIVLWAKQAPTMPGIREVLEEGALGPYIAELASTGPAQWLLLPCRAVVAPWFAEDTHEFLRALVPALGIIALHYFWVVRSQVAFEEASLQLTEKRAAMVAARRAGDFRFNLRPRLKQQPIFVLRPRGWPALAFVWKSWIRFGGRRVFRLAVFGAIFCVVVASAPLLNPAWQEFSQVSIIAGFAAVCALLFSGPQMTAQALRRELQAVEWLKACPVRPTQIIFGQLLGPALLWTALELIGFVVMAIGALSAPQLPIEVAPWIPVALIAALLLLPAFNIVASLVPAGVMLLFPGWFKPGEMRGIEATGLGLLMVFAQVLFLALSLVPVVLVFGGVGFVLRFVLPLPLAALAGCVAGAATLAAEAWCGALVLGGILARFDASAER